MELINTLVAHPATFGPFVMFAAVIGAGVFASVMSRF